MRRALGAGSPRILRQLVTESLVLSLAGALVGLTVGSWGIGAFRAQDAVRLPEYAVISLDFRIVGISLVAALVLAGILALGPSLALLRDRDGMGALGSSRASTGATGSRVRSSLVAGEVALALVLLVGAGLLLESYRTLRGTGYGFDTERLFLAQVDLNGEERVAEDQRILARALSAGAAALPGVEGAFIWSPNRLGHGNRVSILTAEDRWDTHPEERVEASQHAVHPGALDALGIRRLAGRDIEPSDREGNPRVALVSESLARRLWPGEEPVGRRMETREGGVPVTVEVVGVVGDARHRTRLINPFQDQLDVYYAFEQRPWPFLTVSLRYEPGTQVESLARDVRTLVRDLEPSAPVHGVTTMAQRMRDEEGTSRLGAWLVGAYGVLATALAALGLYGVLAHSVRLRLREIGIRQALGADRGRVLRNVLGRGLGMVALGLLAGSVGAYLLGPLMAAALYGVEPTAWRVFVSVVVLLGAAATAACLLPAWHATRVDPATILRTD